MALGCCASSFSSETAEPALASHITTRNPDWIASLWASPFSGRTEAAFFLVSSQPPLSYIQTPTAQPWHFLVQRALMTPLINTFQFPSWHSRPLLFSNKYSPVMFPPGHLYRPVLTQLDLILFTEFAPCFLSLSLFLFQMPPWITRMISFYIYCLDGHTHSVGGGMYMYMCISCCFFSSSINSLRGKCQLIFCWIFQSF